MRTEREIAELIFDQFRAANCKAGEIIMERNVQFGIINNLNPKEQELCFIVIDGLINTGYITYRADSPQCFFLTEKGYDYIYDDEKVAAIRGLPWIFPSLNKTDWDKAYFKLWKVIGPQESASHYLGGSQFYKIVMDLCDDIPPSYSEYIELRKKKDISTSRVKYYKDLIDHLPEDRRVSLYAAIQIHIEININITKTSDESDFDSFWDESAIKLKPVVTSERAEDIKSEKQKDNPNKKERPKVFISYAWGKKEEYKPWVKKLADSLENEIAVILDQNELGFGSHLTRFMTNGIEDSDRILVILTPLYKEKSRALNGGTAFEEAIISTEILGDIDGRKIIPILREGSKDSSAPLSLKGLIYCDMTDDNLFQNRVAELKGDILQKFERDNMQKIK